MPRSNSEFINGVYSTIDGNNFSIFHGTGENKLGTQSGSLVSVSGPTGYYRDYNDLATAAERRGYEPERYEDAFPTVRDEHGSAVMSNGERVRQGVLFEDTRQPPTVDLMLSTKDARHNAASMLAATNKKSQELYGQNVKHSTNLSEFSLPLVNRLIRAGMAPGPEISSTGNSYDWNDAHNRIQSAVNDFKSSNYNPVEEIDNNEYSQGGRDFSKRLIAAEKARGIKPDGSAAVSKSVFGRAAGAFGGKVSRLGAFQSSLPGMSPFDSEYRAKDE